MSLLWGITSVVRQYFGYSLSMETEHEMTSVEAKHELPLVESKQELPSIEIKPKTCEELFFDHLDAFERREIN